VQFRIKIEPGAQGVIALSYLRSKKYELGRVTCWARDADGNVSSSSSSSSSSPSPAEPGDLASEDGRADTKVDIDAISSSSSSASSSKIETAKLGEATFDGFWTRGVSIPVEGTIASGLPPGRAYEVTCKTPRRGFRGKEFRIMGLLSR
jgi:hypothetical protein